MAVSYDAWKKGYESLNDQEKQQYNDRAKSLGDSYYGNEYLKQYQQSSQPQQTTQQALQPLNPQKAVDNRQQSITPKQPDQYDMTAEEYRNQNRAWVQKTVTPQEIQSSINDAQAKMQNQNVSPELDTSKFNQDPWKITVQEWSAQQTWRPDYQASNDARLNEMKGNLDHYFATSPRMFNDRETFNKVFEYNSRESDAQRQLLDSYWKRKEDMDKASQYTSWESIANGLKNSEITTDQLNLIKEYSPEAYKAWQEQQEEQIKLRIVNGIVPPMMEDIASQINDMINRLGIQAQDALDIEWIYNETMDRTGAWQTLEDCNKTVRQIEEVNNKRTAIMSRYAASTWGTQSDALAAARMQKALAPYNTEMEGLQYQYQDYANLYSQKTATATQAANVRALQAQENQRIWNQKTAALWFATDAMSYRTPEQQAQLDIQRQQALNDVNLLYTSQLNDLNRYNQYATTKMQNQLQQELTDLSVEDEAQLKANLNNALSDYYKNYWDIIQRSQSQAVDDIIAYAKKNGISVAQALTENFIKPLQNKAEYKQKVATDYGMLSKQSIGTINWRSVIMTTNPNWSISYQYIDSWITDSYTIDGVDYVVYNWQQMTAKEFNEKYWSTVWNVKPYDMVDSKVFDTSLASHSYYTLRDFMDDAKNQVWKKWGQCAKFVNDYLEKIWVGRYFGTEDIKTREQWINSNDAKVWTIAIFDYNHYTDWKNYGHVWIVVDTDENGFWVLDSNWDLKNPWVIEKRYIRYGSSSCKWFFDPSQPPRATSTGSTQAKSTDRLTLTALRNGQIVNSKVPETINQLVKAWFSEDEINEALNQNMEYYLPDDQRSEKNAILNAFRQNDIVQNFQSATEQFLGLSAAVNEANWAWDLSTIYQFMRSQDPRSVVREWEFDMAASTMWLWGQVQTWFTKLASWQRLTPEQRQNFIDVTVKVLESKKQAYKIVYDEAIQQMKAASIPSVYYPTDWTKELDNIITKLRGRNTSWPDDMIYDIYSSAMNNSTNYSSSNWWYNNMSYWGYSSDFIQSMIYSKL